jgi:hypothetical protein
MNRYPELAVAMEGALLASGAAFNRLTQLPRSVPSSSFSRAVPGYGMFALDVTVTTEGSPCIIEVNGSNCALTSTAIGTDLPRALNMALAFTTREPAAGPAAILLGHRPGLQFLAEFYARAVTFRELLADLGWDVELVNADTQPRTAEIAIVCGAIPELADHIERDGAGLRYRGRQVVFAQNPNLVPELVRRGDVRLHRATYDLDLSFFHEGAATPVVHDKVRQQQLAEGTGFAPLRSAYAWSYDEAVATVGEFHDAGVIPVAKGFAGSGGAAIGFFPRGADPDRILDRMLSSAQRSYGEKAGESIFPIQFFEFATSVGYPVRDGRHLWDLRMLCLLSPGTVTVQPCVIRLCPAPFTGVYEPAAVKSNLTGRAPTLRFVRAASAHNLRRAGVDDSVLGRLAEACANWSAAATWATRSGAGDPEPAFAYSS